MLTTVLLLLVGLSLPVAADPRFAVTLRSGFTLEAEDVASREGQLALRIQGGEILLAHEEVAAIDALPAAFREPTPSGQASATDTNPPAPVSIPQLIDKAAERHGLPPAFVRSVAEAESAFRPNAVSSKGARGVMQLMPGTAQALGVNPDDPAENIEGGARLLRMLLLQYQDQPDQVRRALAAYNAGAGAVQKHGGVPPYRETQVYVERVLRKYRTHPDTQDAARPR